MGALSDYLGFGGISRLQLIAVAMSVAVIGTQGLIYFNIIQKEHLPYINEHIPVISHLIGGILFGIGMMLASGCPTQQCVNLGKGNLKSLLAIPIIAITAQITLSGSLSSIRLYIDDLLKISHVNLYEKLPYLGILIGLILLILCVIWLGRSLLKNNIKKSKFIEILFYGSLVGFIVIAMWYICGHLAFIAEDELTLEHAYIGNSSKTIQSLSMILPTTYLLDWLMYSSDSMRFLNANTMLIFGLIIGSVLICLFNIVNNMIKYKNNLSDSLNDFELQFFKTPQDFLQYFLGSILMGIGGVLAIGCSVGQGLSAFSTLSIGSVISIIGMFIGAKIVYKFS
ncbi:MAG: hypothetical protein RLZZ210_130 [Pseudomonadota bacterium]|jgi:uncharacterized membrane protein YedE/YeeE